MGVLLAYGEERGPPGGQARWGCRDTQSPPQVLCPQTLGCSVATPCVPTRMLATLLLTRGAVSPLPG